MDYNQILSNSTPRPWKIDPMHGDDIRGKNNALIVSTYPTFEGEIGDQSANAAIVLRAVNSHEPLVSALKTLRACFEPETRFGQTSDALQQADAAIKLAESAS